MVNQSINTAAWLATALVSVGAIKLSKLSVSQIFVFKRPLGGFDEPP